MTKEETVKALSNAAGVVKLICGVGNNAAWLVMLDGYDHARRCRGYKQKVKKAFRDAVEAFHVYERGLLYATENRMFHIADMSAEVRKKYGDISDRDYYDFWSNTGGFAYQKTKPLITSLWNKYRLSLESHGVEDAEHVAWVMTAMAALELACRMYDRAVMECVSGYGLPERLVTHVFGGFRLHEVSARWRRAMVMLAPGTDTIELGTLEERNIEHGLEQLTEAWVNPTLLYNSTMDNVEDSAEVFRTAGEQKKSMREIATVREETEKELAIDN